jgi:hypothetical protein
VVQETIHNISNTTLVLSNLDDLHAPTQRPAVFSRLWCCIELGFTASSSSVMQEFNIAMAPPLQQQFEHWMLNDWDTLTEAICDGVDLEDAAVSSEAGGWVDALRACVGPGGICPSGTRESTKLISSLLADCLADMARERLRKIKPDMRSTSTLTRDCAKLLKRQGRLGEAQLLFRQVRRRACVRRCHTCCRGMICVELDSFSVKFFTLGAEPTPPAHQYLAGMQHTHGEHHLETLSSKTELGMILHARWFNRESEAGGSTLESARELLEQAWEGQKLKLGEEHGTTLDTLTQLALVHQDSGDVNLAAVHLQEAVRGYHLRAMSTPTGILLA